MTMISSNMLSPGEAPAPMPTVPVSDVKSGGSNIQTVPDPYKGDEGQEDAGAQRSDE
jgi:hypothetical protein